MTTIRLLEDADWPATWAVLEPVLRAGETYSIDRDVSEEDARAVWVEAPEATFVAVDERGRIVGTYYLKPNQPGQGSHVCNCGYIVGEDARGSGVATAMCEHSQREAIRRGFRAMQYNLVVATNRGAVRLWERLGFGIVGTLPGAFRHPREGYVDALVMYKELVR
jgi:RimJ/RimL family protein N-acetyltransferase